MKNALRRLCFFVAFLPLPIAAEAPSEDLVREAQFLLMAKGINAGPIDGKLGRKTKKAIREYEKLRNLRITGQPTDDLISKLRKETQATSRGSHGREPKDGATVNSDIREEVDFLSQETKNLREHVVAAEQLIRKVDNHVGDQLINGFRDLAILSFAIFGIIVTIFLVVAPFVSRRMSRTIREQVESTHDSMIALSIAKINALVYANIGGHCIYLYKDLPGNRDNLYKSYLTLAVHISGLGYRYAKDLQTAMEEKRPAVRRHLLKVLSWLGRTPKETVLLEKIENLVYGCINNYVYYLAARADSEDKKHLLNILKELKTISVEKEKVKDDNPEWCDYKETVAWAEFRLGRMTANDLQKLVQTLINDKDVPPEWKRPTVARYDCHNRFRHVPPTMDEIVLVLPD